MEITKVFAQFKEQDYAVVNLYDLGDVLKLRPVDVAQAIIDTSQQGKKPVNFRLSSSYEYWDEWTHTGRGGLVFAALEYFGYSATFMTNITSDGFYCYLERKQ